MKTNLQGTFKNKLPSTLKNAIKSVHKKTTDSDNIVCTTTETIWIPSATEIGFNKITNSCVTEGQGDCYTALFDIDITENSGKAKRIRNIISNGYPTPYSYPTRSRFDKNYYLIGVTNTGLLTTSDNSGRAIIGFCV